MTENPDTRANPERLAAGATRCVRVAVPAVRERLLPVLRQLDFSLTLEQFSLVVAERGSHFGGLTMSASRVPVGVRIDLDPSPDGVTVTVRVEDRWKVPLARNWGAVAVYAHVFADVLGAIDAMLARLDPIAAAGFDLWWRTFDDAAAANESVADAAARAESMLSRQAARVLDGAPSAQQRSAMDGAGLATITFAAPDKVAQLQADDVDGLLTAGQLIASRPGALPAPLVKQVQQFVIMLENDLERPSERTTARRVTVDAWAVPVVSFLYQQAKLREVLAMRILLICTTCRLEKIVNPDFARMQERSRRAKVLTGSIGMVFGSHHVSPYILVGKLVQMKKTDPDYVCARCQGLDADQMMITFCPRCGDRRGETVLRSCPKCQFEFRTMMPATALWQADVVPPPALSSSPALASTPGSSSTPGLDPTPAAQSSNASAPPAGSSVPPTVAGPPTEVAEHWSAPVASAGAAHPMGSVAAVDAGSWTAPAASSYGADRSTGPTPFSGPPAPAVYPAGWFPDRSGRHQLRYWDGVAWTTFVSTNGEIARDSVE